MARQLAEYDLTPRMKNLRDQGWCAFEAAFDSAEIQRMNSILHGFVKGLDASRLTGFGATIFSLSARNPEMRQIMENACVLLFIEQAMGGAFDFRRSGARISGRTSQERIIWHHHHGWMDQKLEQRKHFDRMHFICYLNGTEQAAGPLIVKPRAFSDPMEQAPEKRFEPLEDEVSLEFPPGTILVMDAPILHSAWRSTDNKPRTIWGAHVQSKRIDLPHPDDDDQFEKVRVRARHQLFRWKVRDEYQWVPKANNSPLPRTAAY